VLGSNVRRATGDAVEVAWPLPPRGQSQIEVLDRKLLIGNPLVHSSILARRSALASVGGYSVDRRYQFDHDLYLRGRRAGLGLARLDEALVLKRVHGDQVFEAAAPAVPRLVSAWRLQVTHARGERAPQRYLYIGAASVRLGARVTRSSLRRMRTRT
jgi:hypothetical protein